MENLMFYDFETTGLPLFNQPSDDPRRSPARRPRAYGGAEMSAPMPKRIQRRRTKGWRMPPGAVYVGRPTRWGNPYRAWLDATGDPAYLVDLYRAYLTRPEQAALVAAVKADLRGKDLACWCPLNRACHADVLIKIANGGASE